jgi:ribosomal protein L40E
MAVTFLRADDSQVAGGAVDAFDLPPMFIFLVVLVVIVTIVSIKASSRAQRPGQQMCRACGATQPGFAKFCRRCGREL